MPGPLPKPADRRQRRPARPTGLVALDGRPRTVPAPPAGLEAASVAAWTTYWRSPLASTLLESDRAALDRLFTLRDERARAFRVAKRARIVQGSQKQPVLSPLLGYVSGLDAEIRQLEDRFGLSPRSRLQLGVTFGEAHRSLAELNRAFMEGSDDPDDAA